MLKELEWTNIIRTTWNEHKDSEDGEKRASTLGRVVIFFKYTITSNVSLNYHSMKLFSARLQLLI